MPLRTILVVETYVCFFLSFFLFSVPPSLWKRISFFVPPLWWKRVYLSVPPLFVETRFLLRTVLVAETFFFLRTILLVETCLRSPYHTRCGNVLPFFLPFWLRPGSALSLVSHLLSASELCDMQDSEEKHSALVSPSSDAQKAVTHVIDPAAMLELLKTESPEAALHGFQLFFESIENIDEQVKLLTECAVELDSVDRVSADSCRGLACMARFGFTSRCLSVFAKARGNMLHVWADNTSSITSFLRQFPSAASSLALWAAIRQNDSADIAKEGPKQKHRRVQLGAGPGADAAPVNQTSLLPPPPPPPAPAPTGRENHAAEEDYADFMMSDPPVDPIKCVRECECERLLKIGACTPWRRVYKFVADAAAPARLRRWHWWKALAFVGIYVRELYRST